MRKRKIKTQKGLTLIEVLLVLAIIGILALAILGIQYILSKNQIEVWRNYLSVDEANTNITTMVRELRNVRPGENGAYPLERAMDQEIIFYSDIDYDGQSERVRYVLNGQELVKGVIEPQGFPATYPQTSEKIKTVAANVRNATRPIFYYFNGDWPADTTNNPLDTPTRLSETKLMKVYLEINPKPDDSDRNFTLESYTQLRTLKENL